MSRPNLYIFGDQATDQHRLLVQAQVFREYITDHAAAFVPTPPTRILDLGCGGGQLSIVLHDLYPQADLVGIDRSPVALAAARRQPGLEQATFVEGDIQQTLPPGPFDLIYTSMVLSHIPALATVIERIYAALAPGGTLWVKDLHPAITMASSQPDYQFLSALILQAMRQGGGHPELVTELPPLLAAAGFTAIQVHEDERYSLGGESLEGQMMLADMLAGIRTAAPFLSRLARCSEDELAARSARLLAAAMADPAPLGQVPLTNIIARRPLPEPGDR